QTPTAAQEMSIPTSSPRKNEVSASGDFLYGLGYVTMPFFFSLREFNSPSTGSAFTNLHPFVASPPRNSTYEGVTLSYSRGQSWFLDLSYAHGNSSGTVDIQGNRFPPTTTQFSIDDKWYQAFVRYVPKRFLTTPWTVYLRAGFSYVD